MDIFRESGIDSAGLIVVNLAHWTGPVLQKRWSSLQLHKLVNYVASRVHNCEDGAQDT